MPFLPINTGVQVIPGTSIVGGIIGTPSSGSIPGTIVPTGTPSCIPGGATVLLCATENFGGDMIELSVQSATQIYAPFDYDPYFQSFNDTAQSAILEPGVTNAQCQPIPTTFFLFKDAGFQGGFDALYFDYDQSVGFIQSDPSINAQGSSAIIVQHPAPPSSIAQYVPFSVNISLQSVQPYLQQQITNSLNNFVNGANPASVGPYTLNGIKLTDNISFQFQFDTVYQDVTVLKLPLQLEFVGSGTPDVKFNLYLTVKISLGQGTITKNGAQQPTGVLQFTYLSYSAPIKEFSNWGIFAQGELIGYPQIFHKHLISYFNSHSSVLASAVNSNTTPLGTDIFSNVYTVPWTLNTNLNQPNPSNKEAPYDPIATLFVRNALTPSSGPTTVPSYALWNTIKAYDYDYSYFSTSNTNDTDILLCFY